MSTPKLIVERDVEARMRDGTILRANVYRPDVPERLPVLLQRTPYGKDFGADFCVLSAARGYAVVVQDTRGRWASDGKHFPFRDEFTDGYDSVEWAAAQPWANGKVGMWGGSYVGFTQWAAAAMCPPSLVTIVPTVTFTDTYRDAFCPGGALGLGVAVSWSLGSGVSMEILRLDAPQEQKTELQEQLFDALDGMTTGKTFRALPLTALPMLSRPDLAQGYLGMATHPDDDDFWAQMDASSRIPKMTVSALHFGGWYDIFAGATPRDYAAMARSAATEMARHSQKLIMGPWLHGPLSGLVGDVDYGMRASDMAVLSNEVMWRWFDYWLKGIDNGILNESPVRIFVMGKNRWREENEWPLARTVYTPYYLHSAGKANTLNSDGVLSVERPTGEPQDRYTYDPHDPVPTQGGGLCCSQAALPGGAFDQRQVEERKDVLVYTSAMLEQDLEVTGPLKVVLWAESSAVDTDWTAKLVDVHPCGYARNLCDGIIRARYRHGAHHAELLAPGVLEEYVIELGPTSNVFLAGHRIRLEISSSNFPRFDRNLNTGRSALTEDDMLVAQQIIYHDAAHPSHIVLPVIPA
jgi:hypothetical protein